MRVDEGNRVSGLMGPCLRIYNVSARTAAQQKKIMFLRYLFR